MTDNNSSGQKVKPTTAYHASLEDFTRSANPRREDRKRRPRQGSNGFHRNNQNNSKMGQKFASEGRAATEQVDFKASKTLKLCHLAGLQEVGRNMSFLEYGDDIIIIDAGFGFPTEDMPGVDYVIPDTTYLTENRSRIKGLVLTHGHMDHIGAIPYIIEKIGSPTIYGSNLSIGMLKEKLEEFGLSNKVKTVVIDPDKDELRLGIFKVGFFRVNHNIPDSCGLVVDSPAGKIVHTGDFKFDLTPINEPVIDLKKVARIGKEGVLALIIDGTSARKPGYAISETEIKKNLLETFGKIKGRVFIASFSSLVSRIQQVIDVSVGTNRKLTVVGRSMLNTIELTSRLGYLKIPEGLIITPQQAAKLPDDKQVILSTGTQGEDAAALTRMSRGDHKFFKIKKGDTVILSSSIIPGNERGVIEVYDNLLHAGAKVLDYKQLDIHTSGHGHAEEVKTMIRLVNPKYVYPFHGSRYFRNAVGDLAKDLGYEEDKILLPDDGEVYEFTESGNCEKMKVKVPTSYVLVDGLGVGDVGNIVLRDRQAMAEGGIFVVILTVDHQTSQIVTSPDIISRGFVYMRAAEDLIHRARNEVKNIFHRHISRRPADWQFIKSVIREEVGEFLFNETKRRPMVIPVIIEV